MVTLKDIARVSGLNAGSVSHILNNSPRALELKAETRSRVLSVARELGYRRNEYAHGMRSGASQTIALLCDFPSSASQNTGIYVNRMMNGVLREATTDNYSVKLYDTHDFDSAVGGMEGYRIKHAVILGGDSSFRSRLAAWASKKKVRLVYVTGERAGNFLCVNSSDREGVRTAVKHLLELGHKRIGLINTALSFYFARERQAGYQKALEEGGLAFDPSLVSNTMTDQEQEKDLERLLTLPKERRPTAFMSLGDYATMLLQRQLLLQGLRFPEDISIISFGDDTFTKYAFRPLSYVSQPFEEMGSMAVRLSLGLVDAQATTNGQVELPTKLELGESIGPCPS